eukprot:Hpha_TRINITY_DN30795_c0_g1::TRINITY_DN30795_c0_g1_i1::g.28345::m.28345
MMRSGRRVIVAGGLGWRRWCSSTPVTVADAVQAATVLARLPSMEVESEHVRRALRCWRIISQPPSPDTPDEVRKGIAMAMERVIRTCVSYQNWIVPAMKGEGDSAPQVVSFPAERLLGEPGGLLLLCLDKEQVDKLPANAEQRNRLVHLETQGAVIMQEALSRPEANLKGIVMNPMVSPEDQRDTLVITHEDLDRIKNWAYAIMFENMIANRASDEVTPGLAKVFKNMSFAIVQNEEKKHSLSDDNGGLLVGAAPDVIHDLEETYAKDGFEALMLPPEMLGSYSKDGHSITFAFRRLSEGEEWATVRCPPEFITQLASSAA